MNFCLQVDGPITDGGGGGVLPAEVDAGCFTMCLRPLKIIIIKLNLNQAARNPEIIIENNGKLYPY